MDNSLLESLKAKNDYFKQMANLIPPQFYFEQEQTQVTGGKYFKNPKENAPKQSRKERVKAKKAANKLKRLDPSQHKTVTDIQDEMAAKEQKAEREGDDESSDQSEDEGVHSANDSDDDDEPKMKRMKGPQAKPINVEKVRTGTSLDELRGKLQKRIEELKLKRKAPGAEGDNAVPRKMSKKMKRAEKKKQEKMEAIQASKKKLQDSMRNKAKLREAEEDGGQTKEETQTSQKEEVAFSKFAFEEFDHAKKQEEKKKRKKHDDPRSGKDYVRLLKKVEKHKQELTDLKERDPDKAQKVITKETWQKAMNKAQGIKVKDDPDLLKKSMRREQQKKKRSTKSWKSREKQTQSLIKAKQDKRNKNIQARKDSKKSKKVKRLQKKGKLLLQD
ncbi:uncharacterized protein [Amphiura filiformis]|uniref:uncharacterized protein n=1 Tax=Amphiura filiformis TaxID=82378 RepID=UPI003B22435D